MRIFPPATLHRQGRRDYNEDFLYPAPDDPSLDNTDIFMVCDGVGLSNRGDYASRLVCEVFPPAYRDHASSRNAAATLQAALKETEHAFSSAIREDQQLAGMATTLTFLHLGDDSALVAWAGDSRIYHIRDGEVLFVTKDHSVVQELVDSGKITLDEAESHPRRNVITRAISATESTKLDHHVIKDLRPGDYLMLCSDGVSGCLDSEFIAKTFRSSRTAEEIRDEVDALCKGLSKDNYTMYLLKMADGSSRATTPTGKKSGARWVLLFMVVLAISAAAMYFMSQLGRGKAEPGSIKDGMDTTTHHQGTFFTTPRPDSASSDSGIVDTAQL